MNDITLAEIEITFIAKLRSAIDIFSGKSIRRLDIGIFPWHGTIELSALCAGDTCQIEDIADRPHYNFSAIEEGRWPEAVNVGNRMKACWEKGVIASDFYELFGEAMKSQHVQAELRKFRLSEDFSVTLLKPDSKNSKNYCA